VPTRASCLTGVGSQAVCDGVATGTGIEPVCSRVRAEAGYQQPTRYQVRETGLEPARLTAPGFGPGASACFATPAECAVRITISRHPG
jgi:hypothetical protein